MLYFLLPSPVPNSSASFFSSAILQLFCIPCEGREGLVVTMFSHLVGCSQEKVEPALPNDLQNPPLFMTKSKPVLQYFWLHGQGRSSWSCSFPCVVTASPTTPLKVRVSSIFVFKCIYFQILLYVTRKEKALKGNIHALVRQFHTLCSGAEGPS